MTAAHGKRVLVVDDNVALATALAALLRSWGHEARFAHDGPAAIREARAFLPDVVLLDVGMPGMDGFQVGIAMRREPLLRSTLILSMSAIAQPDDERNVQASGIDRHLAKPLDPGYLRSLLGGHS